MASPEYLSTIDSMLISMENKKVSLGVAGLVHLDGPIPLEDYISDFTHRLELLPRMRQKVVPTPFGLGLPTWEHDPAFDLQKHITQVTLPSPGTDEELYAFASEIMSAHMDFSRSPWEIFLIDGFADGSGAALLKVHHCMTDGQGGERVYGTIMDFEKTGLRKEPAALTVIDHRTPNAVTKVCHALATGTKKRLGEARRMLTGNPPNPRSKSERQKAKALLKTYAKAPGIRFGFNADVSGKTHYDFVKFPLDELRAIRSRHGGTINDVFLTAVTGLLDRVARDEGTEIADRFCRFHLAANTRDAESQDAWGNYATLIPILAPMGIADPLERLRRITSCTGQAKAVNLAQSMQETLTLQSFFLPAPLLKLLAASITSATFNLLVLRFKKNLPRNLYATNVRWPEITAYMGGRKIENFRPLLPVGPTTGLIVGAITYGSELQVSLAADPACIPDVKAYGRYLREAYEELRDAAGVSKTSAADTAKSDSELSQV